MVRVKGSISIFLMMSLVLMMGLICTLIEAGRVNCINAKLRGITYMAADSCFAEYVSEIFDEYGVMALWKDEAGFTREFNNYIDWNLHTADLDIYQDGSLYSMELDASAINDVKRITDDGGVLFLDQVCEYMEYHLPAELITKVLGNLQMFSSGSKLASFIRKINSYKDVFIKVGNCIGKIQTAVDKAKSIAYNPKTILGKMKNSINRYEETENIVYVAQFNSLLWNLEADKDTLENYMKTIEDETENYYIYAEAAKNAIDSLQQDLDEAADSYTADTLSAIQSQLDELALKTADTGTDYYRITENGEKASDYYRKLGMLDGMFDAIDEQQSKEHIMDYKATVEYYDQLFDDFNMDELWLNISGGVVKQEDSGFLSTVSDVFSKGLLKAVTGGDISDKKIKTDELPSVTAKIRKDSVPGNILQASYKTVVLGEYILEHFGNYSEQKEETALIYEVEYIIGGKASDNDNLKNAAEKIVMLRTGLNYISFMNDSAKLAQAELMAQAIIGFTGIEPIVETVKTVIIGIWCLAEALCDAKALFAGGKVPAVKEPFEWTISAAGLKNFSRTILPSATEANGLEYKEYLRILLLMQDISDQAFRTMDMIQADSCMKYNENFRMKDCICSIDLQTEYHAGQLFTAFPFIRNMMGNSAGSYSFSFRQQYCY